MPAAVPNIEMIDPGGAGFCVWLAVQPSSSQLRMPGCPLPLRADVKIASVVSVTGTEYAAEVFSEAVPGRYLTTTSAVF